MKHQTGDYVPHLSQERIFIQTSLKILLAILSVTILVFPTYLSTDSDADPSFELTVSAEHGEILDLNTGSAFISGPVTGNEVKLLFIANSGHEFIHWDIKGKCKYEENGITLTISDLEENVQVNAISRNYSTSQELITIVDSYGTPVPGDSLVNAWSFRSTELNRKGSMWEGMPCTPLIVGDLVYVRAGGILYALNVHSGAIVNHVISSGTISYYHYISYGNGVIFDTVGHKAYDLELTYLYDIPENLKYASYHQGYFYGCLISPTSSSYYTMYKTTTDINTDLASGVKVNLFKDRTEYRVFAQYGQFSNVIFENGYFFFLQADKQTGFVGWRAMTAINLETEKSYTVELTGFTGMPWDDGWLSYYNGYFYLTAYTAGLFNGVIKGLENKHSSIMWAKFDFEKGEFETPQYEDIKTPSGSTFRGIASGLEIYEGRGYINVRALGTDTLGGSDDTGTCLIAFDIAENGRPIPTGTASSPMTHGGIVVNTAYDSEGKRYIYLLPYNWGSQGLYVFTDELINGTWTLDPDSSFMNFDKNMNEYCSQAIRVGPDGELMFYLDSGYLQCYVAANRFPMNVTTINEGYANVQKEYGGDIKTVLEKLYPGSEINEGEISIGSKTYTIYGLNEITWSYDALTDLQSTSKYSGTEYFGVFSAPYSQIALVEKDVNPHFQTKGDTGWYYVGNDGIDKCNIRNRASLDSAAGCTLIYSETKIASDTTFLKPYISVAREGTVDIELPESFESSFTYNDDGAIEVSRTGNTLTIKGLKETVTSLFITVGGNTNVISVDVLPKVTYEDGNTITESVTSKDNADGGRTESNTKTVSNNISSSTTSESITYDADGNLLTKIEKTSDMNKNVVGEYILDTPVTSETEESKTTDSQGNIIAHTQYRKETAVKGNADTSTTTYVIESENDLVAEHLVITSTEIVNSASFTSTKTTTSITDNGKTSEKRDQTVISSDRGITASLSEGRILVNIDGESYGNLSKMIEQFDDDLPMEINAKGTVTATVHNALITLGTDITLYTENASLYLSSKSLSSLDEGDIALTVDGASGLSPRQLTAASDAKVYSITLTSGNVEQHQFGEFTISIKCDIDVQEGKNLKVWSIDDYGNRSFAKDVSYDGSNVTFTSDHLSYYAVGYLEDNHNSDSGSDNDNLLIGIATVILLLIIGGIIFLRFRKTRV